MNIELPKARGHSFKFSVLYITHDKRAEGMEAHPTTAERVEWAMTRNMGNVGPETGWRIMADTYRNRDQLKAAAGVRKTKDATAGPVYHFSINWHPDERGGSPSQADMLKTAERVLKVMGAEHLQAVMTAHTDTGNPHLHVVLNLVCPETGRMHAIGKDKGYSLDRWSHEYEIEGGQIFSHDRAAKYAERDRKQEQHPDKAERKKWVDDRKAQAANDRTNEPDNSGKDGAAKTFGDAAARKLSEGAKLKERADALKAKHQQERGTAWADFKAQKDALWKERPSFKAIAAQHRADTRPEWSYFGKEQARQRREFRAEERTFVGRIANAVRLIEAVGWKPEMKGYLGMVFKWWAAPTHIRERALAEQQAREKAAFGARMKQGLDDRINAAKIEHAAKLSRLGVQYDTAKALMDTRHAEERQQMSAAWKGYYDRRERMERPSTARPYQKPRRGTARSYTQQRATMATPAPQAAQTRATGAAAVWSQAAQPKPPAPLKSYWSDRAKPQPKPQRDKGRDREPEPER